jgi:hypothetical protein
MPIVCDTLTFGAGMPFLGVTPPMPVRCAVSLPFAGVANDGWGSTTFFGAARRLVRGFVGVTPTGTMSRLGSCVGAGMDVLDATGIFLICWSSASAAFEVLLRLLLSPLALLLGAEKRAQEGLCRASDSPCLAL